MNFFHYTRSPVLQPWGLPLAISGRADANARIFRGRRDQQGQVIGLRAGLNCRTSVRIVCGTYLKAAESPAAAGERS